MMHQQQMMGVELRFWPLSDAGAWDSVLSALWAWEPRLLPSHVDPLTDLQVETPEPWNSSQQAALAQRLARGDTFSWLLFREDDEETGMQVAHRPHEVELSIRAPRPDDSAAESLLRLLAALSGSVLPVLGMAFAGGSDDAELTMQGLFKLQDVPPLFYLSEWALQRVGGRERIDRLAVPAEPAPGGVLLVVRPVPWQALTAKERTYVTAVRRGLGIFHDHPLRLAPE